MGEVEGGGGGSRGSGSDGEEPGVGEGVEDGLARLDEVPEGGAIVALVDEDALGVAGVEGEACAEAIFEAGEEL